MYRHLCQFLRQCEYIISKKKIEVSEVKWANNFGKLYVKGNDKNEYFLFVLFRWKSSRLRERPVPEIGQILGPGEHSPLHIRLYYIYQHHLSPYNPDVDIEILEEGSQNYNFIHHKFMSTTQPHFRVRQIERVNNMFLKLFYLLKKEEYEILYGKNNVKEEILFHGSTSLNICRICIQNFNWRCHKRQCIFGKGVNFSEISNYASNYCDNDKSETRVMIAATVLRSQSCTGTNNMILPPYLNAIEKIRFDTSQKPDGNVIVKYNDDEFYPEYIIYFTGEAKKKTQQSDI